MAERCHWTNSSTRRPGHSQPRAHPFGSPGYSLRSVRDSKDPSGAALVCTPDEWDAFVGGAKDGEFDRG